MFFFGIIQVGGMLLYHLADFHCSKWREFIVANGGFLLYDLAVLSTGQERVRGKDAYFENPVAAMCNRRQAYFRIKSSNCSSHRGRMSRR